MGKPSGMSDAEWEEIIAGFTELRRATLAAELSFAQDTAAGLVSPREAAELQRWFEL